MTYFQNCSTPDELKARYRDLAKLHHPDLGGSVAIMQTINAEYHAALSRLHEREFRGSDGKQHKYYYNRTRESAIMTKVNELLALRIAALDICIIGSWVWVFGDTKPYKDQLKELKLRWNGKRNAWQWHEGHRKARYNPRISTESIKACYGCESYQAEDRTRINA